MLPILNGEVPKELVDMYYSVFHDMLPPERADEMVDEMIQMAKKMLRPALKQMYGQAEVVSSEYVGDEFHFRLRARCRRCCWRWRKYRGCQDWIFRRCRRCQTIERQLHKIRKVKTERGESMTFMMLSRNVQNNF